ncbi:cytochrome c-type biogenesis protein CcmH [Planctomycetota bacterium]|nr:cytochrome c-type biogenesis protein CcmH [Planctomycetota bacterium]
MNPRAYFIALFVALMLLVPALSASASKGASAAPLTEAEIETRYKAVGDQLFCLCGCRDKLLECSHNVCGPKEEERAFLRELAKDVKLTQAQMKEQMVVRFGEKILLAPNDSGLYMLAAGALLMLVAGFAVGARFLMKSPASEDSPAEDAPAEAPKAFDDSDLDDRIANELKELE